MTATVSTTEAADHAWSAVPVDSTTRECRSGVGDHTAECDAETLTRLKAQVHALENEIAAQLAHIAIPAGLKADAWDIKDAVTRVVYGPETELEFGGGTITAWTEATQDMDGVVASRTGKVAVGDGDSGQVSAADWRALAKWAEEEANRVEVFTSE